ncbi:NAD(P)-dependent oxidoreductase [Ktedonosporobacter rubrisoli]|uniref:NAD(P)-dependent oxidoreductase n=1 Tax=Ktedonosporobacter rubrisoli TaxID=2509675 RepID=A0A4P6JLR7_KTERU|nr:NAD(P)-binding domain-containing protein [Ktedonosporobacter rubrisoli]QBD76154.1 NAD(P)-dependent oxidoreductase [Ktedonosporobacter rubrisoli]
MNSYENTNEKLPSVTVIGLGAMGQALAGAFLNKGYPTTVWNRSPQKADALVARGALRASTAAEAVAASQLVVVCLVDYKAMYEIFATSASSLTGRTLVNLTSDTPERAREAAAWAAEHNINYLDGAILVPTVVIGEPEALIFYSGPQALFEAHQTTLKALGGNSAYLGANPGLAALYDLALLDIFYSSMASIVHAFALVNSENVPAAAFLPYANAFTSILSSIMVTLANNIDNAQHSGEQDNLRMEAEGIAHIIEASQARGLDVSLLKAVKALADRAIAGGHGGDSISRLFDYVKGAEALR